MKDTKITQIQSSATGSSGLRQEVVSAKDSKESWAGRTPVGWAGLGLGKGWLQASSRAAWSPGGVSPAPSHLQTRQQALTISAASPLFNRAPALYFWTTGGGSLTSLGKNLLTTCSPLQSLPRYSPQCRLMEKTHTPASWLRSENRSWVPHASE